MSKERTIRILNDAGFEAIPVADFDPSKHRPLLEKGEIVVKPKNVDRADPFIIDEKDFDERAYERVRLTAEVAEEVATQQDRLTAQEEAELRDKK